MIRYSELKKDKRFSEETEFCQKVFATLNLSDPQVSQLYHPMVGVVNDSLLLDVVSFMKQSNKLMICGDYDCDGITSTTIAMLLAGKLGVDAGYYIPNRIEEGYGVSVKILEQVHQKGYDSVMMIDTGVKAYEAIAYAKSVGLKLCIVDHHTFDTKPDVDVFVHPDLLSAHCDTMCAAGLMTIICESSGYLDDYILALGCVGTIGDVMPLWNKNRELVIRGLEALNKHRFLPLVSLMNGNGVRIDAMQVAFQIVPKINAVGRLADRVNVNTVVPYLMAQDPLLIQNFASQIVRINNERKSLGQDFKQMALDLVVDEPVNIIADARFHEGLLGIVANQLTTITGKPSIVFQKQTHGYKGSARSQTISLSQLFSQVKHEYFLTMGGHDFAYGMTIRAEYFEQFTQEVQQVSQTLESVKQDTPVILMDEPLSKAMFESISHFEPFGTGFQLPLFAILCPKDVSVYPLGSSGVRFSFKQFWLRSAVYFNPEFDIKGQTPEYLIGRFSNHPQYGLSFTVETVL